MGSVGSNATGAPVSPSSETRGLSKLLKDSDLRYRWPEAIDLAMELEDRLTEAETTLAEIRALVLPRPDEETLEESVRNLVRERNEQRLEARAIFSELVEQAVVHARIVDEEFHAEDEAEKAINVLAHLGLAVFDRGTR